MPGRIIVVAQQKGGAGKTTLAVNLAAEFLRRGRSVAVVDSDPQGSLGRWFMARLDRLGAEGAGLDFATSSAWGVSYECEKYRKTHDLVLVDTPPKIDADLRPALRVADLVLVPVSVSHVDLWATESVLELAAREDRPVMIVMNRAAPRTRLAGDVAEKLSALPATRAETVLGNRVLFAETLGSGQSVVETRTTGPAARELAALADEVAAAVDLG
jgi:chromosome partitioning protein